MIVISEGRACGRSDLASGQLSRHFILEVLLLVGITEID